MLNTTALILAGGINLGFSVLTHNRAKSALPFCGHFRVVDFILTNLSRSSINNVGILIQYLPGSLIDHIGVGASWDFATTNRRIKLMPPFIGMGKTDWFRGSADAIFQNLNYITDTRAENVLVLSADHVYSMDYSAVLEFHRERNADLTIVTTRRPVNTPSDHFGYVKSDEKGRVIHFVEKPHDPPHETVSTGIYLFSAQALRYHLKNLEDRATKHDLPSNVVAPLANEGRAFAYNFDGDWNCLPDIKAYVDFHFQVLRGEKVVNPGGLPIITNLQDRDLGSRPSPYFGRLSNVRESMISPGCVVEGTVIRSVLSPGVYVAPHAHVENSILFHDCQVHEGVNLQGVVSDKDVEFHPFCRVGDPGLNPLNPEMRHMTLIGKGAHFAQGVHVGSGKEIQIDQVVQRDWATRPEHSTTEAG
jgi:glucose-1-phosphate adenylyltransferase